MPDTAPPPVAQVPPLPPDPQGLWEQGGTLLAALSHHIGGLVDESSFRIANALRSLLVAVVFAVAAVLASLVGYLLLIQAIVTGLVTWLDATSPTPIALGVYLLATVFPLLAFLLRSAWARRRDLSALERRHERP